ncbi:MAG: RES family NAD+ phosphorylase [Candidatus Palauibacterales bacterium]|nr:RES family NAD+ phosphorylase [Candidatus Palauibacterales bacterium]MDP2531045.1 RES family NAD+ phosphorylase [Candidatus Palauibacterales bacterium]MDP2583526.1 RES family NAD+ phosphorylase [Candidatus Palauibacterales bacterium]
MGAHPLHAGWILRARGRWNRAGEYGCLYTSLTAEAARAEHAKYLERAGTARTRPRELVSIDVDVRPVLDLRDVATRRSLGISLARITGDDPADLDACRAVADWARGQGYRAILAPSAASKTGTTLAVYLEGPADELGLEGGRERIAIG